MLIRLVRWVFTRVIGITAVSGETGPDGDNPRRDSAAILWEESRRQISRQESDLDTLRTRAVALLSVSSLVAGLFGGRVVSTHPHPTFVTVAIIAALTFFGVSVIAILFVLAPRKLGWEFAQNLRQYFPLLQADGPLYPITVTSNLARHVEASRRRNQVLLERLYSWFAIACVLTGLEVIAWGVSVL
jgi:hypothetical protein